MSYPGSKGQAGTWQRTSFKRLAARWLARLDAMPPIKRGFLLNAIRTAQGCGVEK